MSHPVTMRHGETGHSRHPDLPGLTQVIQAFQDQAHVAAPVGNDDHRVLALTEQTETTVRPQRLTLTQDPSGVLTSAGVLLGSVVSPHQPAGGAVAAAHAAVVLLRRAAQLVIAADDLEADTPRMTRSERGRNSTSVCDVPDCCRILNPHFSGAARNRLKPENFSLQTFVSSGFFWVLEDFSSVRER